MMESDNVQNMDIDKNKEEPQKLFGVYSHDQVFAMYQDFCRNEKIKLSLRNQEKATEASPEAPDLNDQKRKNVLNYSGERTDSNSNENSNSKFTKPQARLTAKSIAPNPILETSTENKFNSLEEITLDSEDISNENQIKTNNKLKPITITKTENYRNILESIAQNENRKFEAKIRGKFIQIIPNSTNDHENILNFLKEKDIQGYSFPLNYSKPIKVVVKGLPIDYTTSEISEMLVAQNFSVIKVAQLISRKHKNPLPLFQITLEPNEYSKEIYELTRLSFFKISITHYISPYKTQQCFRCQLFHHHSEYCTMNPRCVKCAGEHLTKDCDLIKSEISTPKCCNCGGEHPASYRGCPCFPHNIRKEKPSKPKFPTSSGISYANIVKNHPASNQSPEINAENPLNSNNHLKDPPIVHKPKHVPYNSNFIKIIQGINETVKEIQEELNLQDFTSIFHNLRDCLHKMKKATSLQDKTLILYNSLLNGANPSV